MSRKKFIGPMIKNHKNSNFLVWAALLLCVVIIYELFTMRVATMPVMAAEARTNVNVSTFLRGNFPIQSDCISIRNWQLEVLKRPLFIANRSPWVALIKTIKMPPALPRLSGILIDDDQKLAVFSGGLGRSIVVAQGSALGTFRIFSVSADSVQVAGPTGMTILHIAYDNAQRLSDLSESSAPSLDDVIGSPWANSWTQY